MKRLPVRILLMVLLLMRMNSVGPSEAADRPPRAIPEGRDTRERFLKLIDRERVRMNSVEKVAGERSEIVQIDFSFDSEAGQRVPGILIKQKQRSTPQAVIIVLHGTGGSKLTMLPLLERLALRGVIAVAIDGRFAGDRAQGIPGSGAYRAALLDTWKSGAGYPFLYDTVWDILRLMDYLVTRPGVDSKRIGAIGFSKGGMELYLAAAVDERLAASVPCIGVQSFGWALEHNAWHSRIGTIQSAVEGAARDAGVTEIDTEFVQRFYDRVAPGIHREFDGPVMLPLIAPRPLLVINGDSDDRTPAAGLALCVAAARRAYLNQRVPEHFEFLLQPETQHAVKPESEARAIDWLIKHLSENQSAVP